MQMTQQRSEYCMTTNSVKFMQRNDFIERDSNVCTC